MLFVAASIRFGFPADASADTLRYPTRCSYLHRNGAVTPLATINFSANPNYGPGFTQWFSIDVSKYNANDSIVIGTVSQHSTQYFSSNVMAFTEPMVGAHALRVALRQALRSCVPALFSVVISAHVSRT